MANIQIAFYKGRSRLFNRAVSWWTRGAYSHCELITEYVDGGYAVCWSSSFSDGGVRKKLIKLNPDNWDVIEFEVTERRKNQAIEWFELHDGQSYDILGLFGFIWGAAKDNPHKWFCSEAVAEALGVKESFRMHPNVFYTLVSTFKHWCIE